MNREIEFRGKCHDTDDGKPTWEYGFVGYCEGKCTISDHDGCGCFIDEDTVGEYTGLRDRHNAKIYEGDILDCGDRIVVVKWHIECGQWDCDFVRYQGKKNSNGITNAEWQYRASIIGNIHDNPEFQKSR